MPGSTYRFTTCAFTSNDAGSDFIDSYSTGGPQSYHFEYAFGGREHGSTSKTLQGLTPTASGASTT